MPSQSCLDLQTDDSQAILLTLELAPPVPLHPNNPLNLLFSQKSWYVMLRENIMRWQCITPRSPRILHVSIMKIKADEVVVSRLIPVSLPTGKFAIPIPRTFPITSTRSRRSPDGSLRPEPTATSSSTTWQLTTAPVLDLAQLPEFQRTRYARPICWSSIVTADEPAAGER